jgi:predicted amidohydrolase
MTTFRIALANLRHPTSMDDSVELAVQAVAQASAERAGIVCFPECFTPGYRVPHWAVAPPDPAALDHAWSEIAAAAARASVAVALGTERFVDGELLLTALVVAADGSLLAYQPYGEAGLLVADLDLAAGTGLLAKRSKCS